MRFHILPSKPPLPINRATSFLASAGNSHKLPFFVATCRKAIFSVSDVRVLYISIALYGAIFHLPLSSANLRWARLIIAAAVLSPAFISPAAGLVIGLASVLRKRPLPAAIL